MRISIIFFTLLLFCKPSQAQDFSDTVLYRYHEYLLHAFQPNGIQKLTASLNFNDQWPDINYEDTLCMNWQPLCHLKRIRALALAWANPQGTYYRNKSVWNTINAALSLWLDKRYKSRNWWYNQIGVPQYMRDIIMLTYKKLKAEQLKKAMAVLAQFKVGGSGANLIWSADLGIHYGALTHDAEKMKKCSQLIINTIRITTGDGIQPDYSFHQHGARLQMYQYGAGFLYNSVRLAWELRGTPWAFPEKKIDILVNFVLRSWQWMARGIYTVPGTMDRSVSRVDALHAADIRKLIPYLTALCPEKAADFKAIYNRQNGQGKQLVGFRYYPYSDFATYQRDNFSFFLKTISNRTLPTESINKENLKGRLLNSGDAYLISDGDEYFNLMPVWNWGELPGITTFDGAEKIDRLPFTGSVSNGISGLTVMDYRMEGKKTQQHLAAFFAAGAVKISGRRSLTVDKPCLILMADNTVFASNPSHHSEVLNINVNNKKWRAILLSDGRTSKGILLK